MRPTLPFPDGTEQELRALLRTGQTRAEQERVLCVWLRVALGLSSADIATALGWQTTSVRPVQARYREQGRVALLTPGRGGRRREWLTVNAEQKLLAEFISRASEGGLAEASAVRAALEQRVGHAVAQSTVYGLLDRHGWRKLAPRPRQVDAAAGAQEAHQQSGPAGCARRLTDRPGKGVLCGSCSRMRRASGAGWSCGGLGHHRV